MTERPWNPIGRAAQADRAVNDMLKKMETCKSCTGNCAGSGACHGTAAEKRAGAPAEDKKIAKKTAAPAPSGPRPRGETAPAAAVLPEIPQHMRKNPNRSENEFMLNLMVLRNSLAKYSPATKERARLAGKYVWRDIRLLFRLVCKIQDALIRTMPDRRDDYYRTYAQHGHYELKMDGPVRGATRFVLISDTNLAAITEAAVESECALCLREGDEIGRCMIRKAMLEVAPPTELQDGLWRKCEYRDIPGRLFRDEEVTV